jgi:hypothetical protein
MAIRQKSVRSKFNKIKNSYKGNNKKNNNSAATAVWKAGATAVVNVAVSVVHLPTDTKEPEQKPNSIITKQKHGCE